VKTRIPVIVLTAAAVLLFPVLTPSAGHAETYALLISAYNPEDRPLNDFWNDTVLIYSMLRSTGQFRASNILVAYGHGADRYAASGFYRPSPPITNFKATRAGIDQAFATLRGRITPRDHLFVWVFDHGGQWKGTETAGALSGDSFLLTTDGKTYTDDDFAAQMERLGYGTAAVFMQQCYSGGFINELSRIPNTLVMTASRGDEDSGPGYTEVRAGESYRNGGFDIRLFAAVTGRLPNGSTVLHGETIDADANGDGTVTLDEVFRYIRRHVKDSTPQMSDPYRMASRFSVYGPVSPGETIRLARLSVGPEANRFSTPSTIFRLASLLTGAAQAMTAPSTPLSR